MDTLTKKQRSYTMSRIRSKDTDIELSVFRALKRSGVYFQKHYKKAPGKPDIALPRKKKAVLIHGDFWHGYRFKKWRRRLPKKYWVSKIKRNMERDAKHRRMLAKSGWKVLTVWQHQLKKDFEECIKKIITFLK